MSKSVVAVVNPEDFKVSVEIAKNIVGAFMPASDKMQELQPEYDNVMAMEESEDQEKLAKKTRLQYVKVRTATSKIHKSEKAEYAGIAKFCDALKNAQLSAGQEIEANLKAIEDRAVIRKEEAIKKLTLERENLIEPYLSDDAEMPPSLGELDETTWNAMLNGMKALVEQNKLKEEQDALSREEREQEEIIKKLHETRLYQTTKLSDFIPDYEDLNFGAMSEKEFMSHVTPAIARRTEKEAQEKKDAEELQALRVKNEKLAKEKEEADKALEEANRLAELKRSEDEARAEAEAKAQAEAEAKAQANGPVDDKPTDEEFSDMLDAKKENPNDTDELKMKRFIRGFYELSLYEFKDEEMKAMHDKFAPKCVNTVEALENMFNVKINK